MSLGIWPPTRLELLGKGGEGARPRGWQAWKVGNPKDCDLLYGASCAVWYLPFGNYWPLLDEGSPYSGIGCSEFKILFHIHAKLVRSVSSHHRFYFWSTSLEIGRWFSFELCTESNRLCFADCKIWSRHYGQYLVLDHRRVLSVSCRSQCYPTVRYYWPWNELALNISADPDTIIIVDGDLRSYLHMEKFSKQWFIASDKWFLASDNCLSTNLCSSASQWLL